MTTDKEDSVAYNVPKLLEDLEALRLTIEKLRRKITRTSGVHYGSQDARHVALDGLQRDIRACIQWIRALLGMKSLLQEKYTEAWEEEFGKLIGGHNESAARNERLMVNYLRLSLIVSVHFKIENLFSNILKVLPGNSPKNGFWNITNTLLEIANIPDSVPKKNRLAALAYMRNAFHSNGMHDSKYTLIIDIDGLKFEFLTGERVECASWQHIVALIRANISVLESILFSASVLAIQGEIPDAFAVSTLGASVIADLVQANKQ